jgi:hypothetical protein
LTALLPPPQAIEKSSACALNAVSDRVYKGRRARPGDMRNAAFKAPNGVHHSLHSAASRETFGR